MATILKPKKKSIGAKRPAGRTSSAPTQKSDERPIWETISELGAQISEEDWKAVPDDSSENYKRHLYGTPAEDV